MAEDKARFTQRQIKKALRLLLDLPVKDGRRSVQETLRLLERGMKDALEKGYSRGEIRQRIAEAEVIIPATTLKDFLAGEQKDRAQDPGGALAGYSTKNGLKSELNLAGNLEQINRKSEAETAGKVSPGRILIKPDTPRDEL